MSVPAGEGKGIPRIIHQTFQTRSVPPEIERNIHGIRALNPQWTYRLYDDEDIVDFIASSYGPRMLNVFRRIDARYGAARADLFRYLLMYKCGGVYLDIKSRPTVPLDDILHPDDCYILSRWRNRQGEAFQGWGFHPSVSDLPEGEFQQWHIVASPGHPFLEAVVAGVLRNIEEYDPFHHGVGKFGVLGLTGPIAYTRAINPIMHRHPHRVADSVTELGFEYSIYGTRTGHTRIFPSHYRDVSAPIVRLGRLRTVWRRTRRLGFRVVRKVGKIAGSGRWGAR
jgi:inositol phosphorylceramide mannosyltransferase catalytic subunit